MGVNIPDIPDNYVKALLTIDIIIVVAILWVGAYQPTLFVILIGFFIFVIVHFFVCVYEWWNQKDIMRDFLSKYSGHPDIDMLFTRSKYPEMLSKSDKTCMITFIIFYLLGFFMIALMVVRISTMG